jgi:transmembrane sensor
MKEELLTRYIVGEVSSDERLAVEKWILLDQKNNKVYLDMKRVWELGERTKQPKDIDIDQAWATFVSRRAEKSTTPNVSISIKRKMGWAVAAVVLLSISVSAYFLGVSDRDSMHLQTFSNTQRDSLPDGSVVTLNRNSALTYHETWFGKNRQVKLTNGETFFEVRRDEERPFVIEAGKSKITVLGTSFHVRQEEGSTEVIVASGSVRVQVGTQVVVLKPQQSALITDSLKNRIKVDTVSDQLYKYYVHQQFVFENTPLTRVFQILHKAYDLQFVIDNPKDGKKLLSVTFEQQTLSEMIDVILKTFDLKMEKKGHVYHIN